MRLFLKIFVANEESMPIFCREECEQFDLPAVDVHVLDEMRRDLATAYANYTIYEEFEHELAKLGDVEWLVFR